MRVKSREIGFVDVQEKQGLYRGDPAITTRLVPVSLDQAIQDPQETIGLECLRLSDDTLHVTTDRPDAAHVIVDSEDLRSAASEYARFTFTCPIFNRYFRYCRCTCHSRRESGGLPDMIHGRDS